MPTKSNKELSSKEIEELLKTLQTRFKNNINRHKDIAWADVLKKLEKNTQKIWSLNEMEKTGGEPDVISINKNPNQFVFYDCSPESPKGRRSLCYDGIPKTTQTKKQCC